MPFKPDIFLENVEQWLPGEAREALAELCQAYTACTTSQQKARSIHQMMDLLDQQVDEATRKEIMQACGRRCITAGVLDRARRLNQEAADLDDLLDRLNAAHIGGRRLRREGQVIHAGYDRCVCGSVSKTREPFTATYCECSCGWYRQLFESLLGKPVRVDLVSSILQDDQPCQFEIHTGEDVL